MTRPVVLLDCDGVLADFLGAFLHGVEMRTRDRIPPSDVTTWDITSSACFGRYAPRDIEAFWDKVCVPGFCANIPVISRAREGVAALKEIADVHVVTTPYRGNDTWEEERVWWLREYFGISSDRVHFAADKSKFAGDVFVDDKYENVEAWARYQLARAYPKRPQAFLWTTPTNLSAPHPDGWYVRTNSWSRILEAVLSVQEEYRRA